MLVVGQINIAAAKNYQPSEVFSGRITFFLTKQVPYAGGILVIELPLAEAQLWRNSPKLSRIVVGKSRSLLGSGHLFYYNVDALTFLLREAGFRVNEMVPVPAMKQRNAYDLLSGVYYHASRSIWTLSSRQIMLGPDFLALASPT